jgi:hypothetical protein
VNIGPSAFRDGAKPPFVIELFCKQAALVRSCTAAGIAACGIGLHCMSLPGCPCIDADLLTPSAQGLATDLITCSASQSIVWIAAPGGSFSRTLERRSARAPLRSNRFKRGCPDAFSSPTSAKCLRRDNAIADLMFLFVELCSSLNRKWYVIGPASSYVWDLVEWDAFSASEICIAGCAYGSGRPSVHKIRGCTTNIQHLQASCPGNHAHLPWTWSSHDGRRSSCEKAALAPPKDFLAKVAAVFCHEFASSLCPPKGDAAAVLTMAKAVTPLVDANKARVAKLSSAAAWQSRGRRLEQLVSEYKRIDSALVPSDRCQNWKLRQRLKGEQITGLTIPEESQILEIDGGSSVCFSSKITFGVPWTPMEFLDRARALDHPFSTPCCPDSTATAIFRNLTIGPAG